MTEDQQTTAVQTSTGVDDVQLLAQCSQACSRLRTEVGKVVVGQEQVVDSMLIALLAGGHALLVGVPGLAKTLLVSSMARALDLSFGRVQFTPDLLPADITGTDVLQEHQGTSGMERQLRFMPGPIFKNLVLADEINRTPPKTQAALLQAMQERKVTVGTQTHTLPPPFQVFATRNPIEQEGTYPLPEAQLDRFLLEIQVGYPSAQEELEIARMGTQAGPAELRSVVTANEVQRYAELVPRMPIVEDALALAVAITRNSRPSESMAPASVKKYVRFGAGPRGSQSLVLAAKARAAMRGEAAADVQDVRAIAIPAMRHRLVLSYRAEAEGIGAEAILEDILTATGR